MKNKIITISIISTFFFFTQNLFAATNYVSITGGHVYPFISWANAATNIQAAVDVASAGNTVLVNDGVYKTGGAVTPGNFSSNRIVITLDIIVKSVTGPENTIILGKGPYGPAAVRGVYMSVGILDGFTISNGHAVGGGDGYYDQAGGGVNAYNGNGVMTNCIIIGNSAYWGGGGVINGTAINCTIRGNLAGQYGGGILYGTANNCVISDNTGSLFGGGTCESTANNCLIIGNAAYGGGGAYTGTLNNCTIADNTADSAGGIAIAIANNCIIWDNSAASEPNFYGGTISYSCSSPLPPGIGNIPDHPLFIDIVSNDYHLWIISPCIDAGSNGYVHGETDLDGNPRILDGIVDMGCYEFVPEPALFLLLVIFAGYLTIVKRRN